MAPWQPDESPGTSGDCVAEQLVHEAALTLFAQRAYHVTTLRTEHVRSLLQKQQYRMTPPPWVLGGVSSGADKAAALEGPDR
jgi:hypothetical protein